VATVAPPLDVLIRPVQDTSGVESASLPPTSPFVGISLGVLIGLVSGFPVGHLFRTLKTSKAGAFAKVMADIGLLVTFWVGGWFGDTAITRALDTARIVEPYLVSLTATAAPVLLFFLVPYALWCVRTSTAGTT
jgi:hypothetical protein